MYKALAYAYCKPTVKRVAIKVAPGILQTYTGVYQLSPDLTVAITTREGKLFALPSDQKYPLELFAKSETEFYLENEDIVAAFVKNEKKQVTHFVLTQRGQNMVVKKIR